MIVDRTASSCGCARVAAWPAALLAGLGALACGAAATAQSMPPATQAGNQWLPHDVHCPDGTLFRHAGETPYWYEDDLNKAYEAACGSPPGPARGTSSDAGLAGVRAGGAALGNALGQLAAASLNCALFDRCPPGWRTQDNATARASHEASVASQHALVDAAFDAEARARRDAAAQVQAAMQQGTDGLHPHDLADPSRSAEADIVVAPSGAPKWGSGQMGMARPGTAIVGNILPTDLSPRVPAADAADYMDRAAKFLAERIGHEALDGVSRLALSGEAFAEEAMGPYGMTAVVMGNAARLPSWEFPQILAAARGDSDGGQLEFQAANRLYTFDSRVNQAVEEGALAAGTEQARAGLVDTARSGVAALASSFLPASEEMRQGIAQTAPELASDLPRIIRLWSTPAETGE